MTKAQIKLIRSLQLKKYREAEGLFVAEGKKLVEELLNSSIQVNEVFISDYYAISYPEYSLPHTAYPLALTIVSGEELEKISSLTTPQGILAICRLPAESKSQPDLKKELVLALDDIRDPGNMGTIIRIADWFGIRHIFCTEECADTWNPKVIQASMGSIARITVHNSGITQLLNRAGESAPVYGALLKGKNIYKERLTSNGILVIGNEARGISLEIQKFITHPLCIPAFNANGPESLNAAAAAAILCSEFRRR
jgi:RNA methyltransferase, TrmH family